MSEFTHFHGVKRVKDTYKLYRLTKQLCWDIGKQGSNWQLVIPAKTTFDISVPRWLEWVQGPHDKAVLLAAAVHDELLRQGFDKAFAAAEFRRAAISGGVGRAKAWLLFFAVLWWTVN